MMAEVEIAMVFAPRSKWVWESARLEIPDSITCFVENTAGAFENLTGRAASA
jgi:hypothetical protein